MTRRARAFGEVAAAYERFRPEYPAELHDLAPADRETVQRRIAAVLPPTVEIDADVTVHLARRRSGSWALLPFATARAVLRSGRA